MLACESTQTLGVHLLRIVGVNTRHAVKVKVQSIYERVWCGSPPCLTLVHLSQEDSSGGERGVLAPSGLGIFRATN